MKDTVAALVSEALEQIVESHLSENERGADTVTVQVERSRDPAHGDFASNVALTNAKKLGMAPRALAEKLCAALAANPAIAKTEIAGPGFINFFLSQDSQSDIVRNVLREGTAFGRNNAVGAGKFRSSLCPPIQQAPCTLVTAAGAAVGDSLARIFEANGWEATREFYYNDAGAQINNLALSVQARCKKLTPEDESWPPMATAASTSSNSQRHT